MTSSTQCPRRSQESWKAEMSDSYTGKPSFSWTYLIVIVSIITIVGSVLSSAKHKSHSLSKKVETKITSVSCHKGKVVLHSYQAAWFDLGADGKPTPCIERDKK